MIGVLSDRLTAEGFEVAAALNETSGEQFIRSKKPDLILLLINLPGEAGFAMLEHLKKDGFLLRIPLIVIFDTKQQSEMDRALELGARDCMTKISFDLDELLNKVNSFLNAKPRASGAKTSAEIGRVLIVEDDTFILNMLDKKLTQSKIKTFRAQDVDQARAILKANEVDAILLDVILPGTNGTTFLKELKGDKKLKKIPVIITSNLGQEEDIKKGLELGAADYLVKAYTTPEEILTKLHTHFAKK